jgi:hypothetical protein
MLTGGIQRRRGFGGLLRVGRGRSDEPLAIEVIDDSLAFRGAAQCGGRPWIAEFPIAVRVASGPRRAGLKAKFFSIC